MASSSDTWIREFNEASKLAEDIGAMISERSSLPASGPDIQRHLTAIRRKITILWTRLESLESILLTLPSMQPMYVTFFESLLDHQKWYFFLFPISACEDISEILFDRHDYIVKYHENKCVCHSINFLLSNFIMYIRNILS